ncbi:MAG: type II toxin-antitoxin system VapC family toxin [Nitrosomonadales bacterium]|nr:type II toxin-antitoxin system VapC family toxin [Nitrosomonadales bacterium]
MILLDTNVLSELMRLKPDAHVVEWLDRQKDVSVWICSITQAEILTGLALMQEGKRQHDLMHVSAAMFDEDFVKRCLPFDSDAAKHYANIVSERTRQGNPISVEDAQIASIARANSLSIATRNVKDFANIQGLAVFNPWQVDL